MPYAPDFYSINEAKKPAGHRVHHNNIDCGPGKAIPLGDRRYGKGPLNDPYRLCEDCEAINKEEAKKYKR